MGASDYPTTGFKKADSYKRTKQLNLPYSGGPEGCSNKKAKPKPQNPPRPSYPAGK